MSLSFFLRLCLNLCPRWCKCLCSLPIAFDHRSLPSTPGPRHYTLPFHLAPCSPPLARSYCSRCRACCTLSPLSLSPFLVAVHVAVILPSYLLAPASPSLLSSTLPLLASIVFNTALILALALALAFAHTLTFALVLVSVVISLPSLSSLVIRSLFSQRSQFRSRSRNFSRICSCARNSCGAYTLVNSHAFSKSCVRSR
jgi:hypothetical protein